MEDKDAKQPSVITPPAATSQGPYRGPDRWMPQRLNQGATEIASEQPDAARNAQEYRAEEARLGGINPYPTTPPAPVIPPISPTMEQVKANWASLPEVEKAKYQAEAAVAAADLARKQALTLEQQRNKGFFGWLRSLFSRKSEPVTEKKVESHSDQAPAPQQPVPEPTGI